MKQVDILIIGGGPAGLSAAIKAYEEGIESILIVERNKELGGILNQCIHNGFGLRIFKEELTGPEYAARLIKAVKDYRIPFLLETMVLDINRNKEVKIVSENGVEIIKGKAIILAMGCRERPRGAINIPGARCAGVFSAGAAQELVNLKGCSVGKEAVILGSGDIGLIMARRLTLEGVKVICVIELMPYSSGLKRNIVQCLDDYNIPLKYNHTITKIVGKERVEGVEISEVSEDRKPIKGTEQFISCDTVLLSVGLIPENELTKQASVELSQVTNGAIVDSDLQTSIPGIFACGNVLHVHDLVDNATLESYEAARSAVKYLKDSNRDSYHKKLISVRGAEGIRYTIPHLLNGNNLDKNLEIKFRSTDVYRDTNVAVYFDDEKVFSRKFKIITPGEMEKIRLRSSVLATAREAEQVTVKIEA